MCFSFRFSLIFQKKSLYDHQHRWYFLFGPIFWIFHPFKSPQTMKWWLDRWIRQSSKIKWFIPSFHLFFFHSKQWCFDTFYNKTILFHIQIPSPSPWYHCSTFDRQPRCPPTVLMAPGPSTPRRCWLSIQIPPVSPFPPSFKSF